MSGLDSQRYSIFSAPTIITGGTFTQQNLVNSAKSGFQRLEDATSPAAFHNSAQRVDPPKCHPNTRDAVLQSLLNWVRADKDRDRPMLWLNGAAGAGKSAIVQTLAELCEREGIPLASFFFSRLDDKRNTAIPLVATLAYQLTLKIPDSKSIITRAIEHDPLIFQQSLATQFNDLIVNPLMRLASTAASDFLVIIDGLDECQGRDVQASVVRCIGSVVQRSDVPLFFLLASRNEGQITMAFNSKPTCSSVIRVALDDEYLSDDDIRRFFNDKFTEIKETHPLAHLIDHQWPTSDLIQELVDKSSGQFIYAAVVIRYVSFANAHPVHRLEIVRGLRPSRRDTPFAELDALYRHIFAAMADAEIARPILAYSILMRHTDIPTITAFFKRSEGSLEASLADLASLVACKGEHIVYLHASLPDFLLDIRRSDEYYIDPIYWHSQFAIQWFKQCNTRLASATDLTKHLQNCKASPELLSSLMDFKPSRNHFGLSPNVVHMNDYLTAIEALDFQDERKAYKCQCARITRLAYETNRDDISVIEKVHNISSPLREIQREEATRKAASKAEQVGTVTVTVCCCLPVSLCALLLYPLITLSVFLFRKAKKRCLRD